MKKTKWNKEKILKEIINLSKNLKRKPVKRDDNRLYQATKKYFRSWNKGLKIAGFDIKDKQSIHNINLKHDEFYYFLGLLITDGHIVYPKRYKVNLYTSNEEEKEMIVRLISKLFKYKASIRSRKTGFSRRENYEIYISSKKLCVFIINYVGIPYGSKSTNVRVPKLLFTSNNACIGNFLRGVIDGDGTILKNPQLKIVSGSKSFLYDLKRLFNKLQIFSGKISQQKQNLYILRVCRKNDLKKLEKILYNKKDNFCYPRKKKIWEQYI